MARPSAPPEIVAYLRFRAREWVNAGGPKGSTRSQRDLAKAVGVTPAQIGTLINTGAGAGWKTIDGMMTMLGLTLPQLYELARDWQATQPAAKPGAPEQAVKRRAHAAELCAEDGVSPEAIRSVLDEPLREEDAHRSTVWWIKRMLRRDLSLAEGGGGRG